MKKIVFLLLFAVIFMSFTIPGDSCVPPPPEYGFTIKWDPANCTSCGTITDKKLTICYVRNNEDECDVYREEDITVTGTSYYHEDVDPTYCLAIDCENCYTLGATIYYYDNSGVCCTGTNSTTVSGTDLNNKTAELLIEMD